MQIPDGWVHHNNALEAEWKFANFDQAMDFINAAAEKMRQLNHHAEIFNVYNRVNLKLTTHDAGSTVTDKDIDLANAINEIGQSDD